MLCTAEHFAERMARLDGVRSVTIVSYDDKDHLSGPDAP